MVFMKIPLFSWYPRPQKEIAGQFGWKLYAKSTFYDFKKHRFMETSINVACEYPHTQDPIRQASRNFPSVKFVFIILKQLFATTSYSVRHVTDFLDIIVIKFPGYSVKITSLLNSNLNNLACWTSIVNLTDHVLFSRFLWYLKIWYRERCYYYYFFILKHITVTFNTILLFSCRYDSCFLNFRLLEYSECVFSWFSFFNKQLTLVHY